MNLNHTPIDKVSVVGDDLLFWEKNKAEEIQEFSLRTAQAFGEGTTSRLSKLKIAVIGFLQ